MDNKRRDSDSREKAQQKTSDAFSPSSTTNTKSAGMGANGSNVAESSSMARKRQVTQRTLMDTRPKPVDAASAQLAIATFFHVCRIAPNVAEHDAFKTMLKKVAAAGTRFTPHGRWLIMGRLLEECKANIDTALKEVKDSWKDVGVCIACDGWTDSEGRPQLNFLAVNAIASVLLFGVDCGTEKKGAEFIAGHLKTGTENVVGLLMDGASANVNAASIIALDYPKVQWTRCTAHSLNLMMKDIGQLDWAKDTIDCAQQLISTLKNAHWITGVLWKEKALQILKPAGTRFGTNYIALERLQAVRKTLDKLVLSEDWEEYVKGKPKIKDAWDTIIDKEFWARVGMVLDVLRPVYKLLRNVDGNQEVMGKIYDKMFVLEDTVKEACKELTEEEKEDVTDIVRNRWNNDINCALHVVGRILYPPNQYESIFGTDVECTKIFKQFIRNYYKARDEHELIKAGLLDSAHWWKFNGTDVPHLSKLARRVLKQCVSASPCETNWAVWESIHTARRNRLGAKRLADLVYVSRNYHTVKKLNEDLAKKLVVSGLHVIQVEEPIDSYGHLDDDDIPDEAYLDGQKAEEPKE
ncbi:unnamed protein product [Closterium sp. NIES-54]